jgi:tRNA nucleotidyltransferase/poly(A) polymerase
VVDLVGGVEDLDRRVLRVLHGRSFEDDPTRILRGCRYVARLDGRFEDRTASSLEAAVFGGAFSTVSVARILGELRRGWADPSFARIMGVTASYGVFTAFPGIDRIGGGFSEAVQRLGSLPRDRLDEFGFDLVVRLLDQLRRPDAPPFLGSSRLPGPVGWGKRRLLKIEREAGEVNPRNLSDETLVLRWVLGATGCGSDKILVERGILRPPDP